VSSSSTIKTAAARSSTITLGIPAWRARLPDPPSSSIEIRTPVNCSTITGPFTKA
jgi:hypothetical protein